MSTSPSPYDVDRQARPPATTGRSAVIIGGVVLAWSLLSTVLNALLVAGRQVQFLSALSGLNVLVQVVGGAVAVGLGLSAVRRRGPDAVLGGVGIGLGVAMLASALMAGVSFALFTVLFG